MKYTAWKVVRAPSRFRTPSGDAEGWTIEMLRLGEVAARDDLEAIERAVKAWPYIGRGSVCVSRSDETLH